MLVDRYAPSTYGYTARAPEEKDMKKNPHALCRDNVRDAFAAAERGRAVTACLLPPKGGCKIQCHGTRWREASEGEKKKTYFL